MLCTRKHPSSAHKKTFLTANTFLEIPLFLAHIKATAPHVHQIVLLKRVDAAESETEERLDARIACLGCLLILIRAGQIGDLTAIRRKCWIELAMYPEVGNPPPVGNGAISWFRLLVAKIQARLIPHFIP